MIVGGGIAGSTLGLALARVGVGSVILEKYGGRDGAGGGIGLWGPAWDVLRVLGVKLEGGLRMHAAAYRVSGPQQVGRVWVHPTPLGSEMESASKRLRACVCVERSRLQDALNDALQREPLVQVRRGVQVCRVGQDGRSVTLADGEHLQGIDLLVGADGLHSVVREKLFPGSDPFPSGYSYWRGIARNMPMQQTQDAFEEWAPGRRFGVVALSESSFFWFAVRAAPTDGTREVLAETFPEIASYIHASEDIVSTPIFDMPRLPRYHYGRSVVLIGDAAHVMAPNLAQGISLAMEDAMLLAHHVGRGGSSYLSLFSQERTRRIHLVQRLVVMEHHVGMASGWKKGVRDLALVVPHFLKTPIFDLLHRIALGWRYTPPALSLSVYEQILGRTAFLALPRAVQLVHGSEPEQVFRGDVVVRSSIWARLMGLPRSYSGPFTLSCSRTLEGGERWVRRFGDVFETTQINRSSQLVELFRGFQFVFDIAPCPNGFEHVLVGISLSKIPIERWLWRRLIAFHAATNADEKGMFYGQVRLRLLGARMLEYDVRLEP